MDVNEAFNRLLTVQVEELDRVAVEAVLRDVRVVHGFVESVRLRAVARLESIAAETGNADPAASAAAAARTSRRHAERSRKRAAAAAAAPPVGDELANGGISPEHLDALGSALARLEPAERAAFIGDGQEIAALARATTADEFSRALDARIQARFPGDPLRRFAQQRRDTTFRWWRDPVTGMVRVFGEFDPERGLALVQRLARTVEDLFHDATPEDCPSDPERKQGHLRALALLRLVLGIDGLADSRNANGTPPGPSNGTMEPPFGPAPTATSRSARRANSSQPAPGPHQPTVDMIVVIDLETLRSGVRADSRVDLPLDADLPIETLRRLACTAGIVPAVLDGDGVVLDVGRRQRLATADQRRALRTMYRTCGLDPGCRVPFDRCEPHHIDYWTRDLGPTDLVNLVPACVSHHHMVHEGGWVLSLRPTDRRLTITYPDGSIRYCWPDSRSAGGHASPNAPECESVDGEQTPGEPRSPIDAAAAEDVAHGNVDDLVRDRVDSSVDGSVDRNLDGSIGDRHDAAVDGRSAA